MKTEIFMMEIPDKHLSPILSVIENEIDEIEFRLEHYRKGKDGKLFYAKRCNKGRLHLSSALEGTYDETVKYEKGKLSFFKKQQKLLWKKMQEKEKHRSSGGTE